MVKSIVAAALLSALSLGAYAQTRIDQGTGVRAKLRQAQLQGQNSTTGTSTAQGADG